MIEERTDNKVTDPEFEELPRQQTEHPHHFQMLWKDRWLYFQGVTLYLQVTDSYSLVRTCMIIIPER